MISIFLAIFTPILFCVTTASTPSTIMQGTIYYDSGMQDNEKMEIEAYLGQLSNLTVPSSLVGTQQDYAIGRELITRIQALLNEKQSNILIKLGTHTLFNYKKEGAHELMVNMDQLRNSRVGCVIPVNITQNEQTAYPVGSDMNPPEVTLGHELVHAIHALENHASYTDGLSIFKGNLWLTQEPTSSVNLTREANIWTKNEEQLTVLGEPRRGPQFSEFWLRLASGRLPRYAYQRHDEPFYESTDRIQYIMQTLLGDQWKDVLLSLSPITNEGALNALTDTSTITFNAETAQSSNNSVLRSHSEELQQPTMTTQEAFALRKQQRAQRKKPITPSSSSAI